MISLKALIVEDDADDATLLARSLRDAGFDVQWTRVETEPDFLSSLRQPLDIIFSDFSMPLFGGMRALELLRASGLDVPLILISGTVGEEVAVEAMRQGATDYLLKDRVARLASAVQRALNDKRIEAERRQTQEALRKSDQRLRSIMERMLDCVMVVRPDGTVSEMNRAGLAMLEADDLEKIRDTRFADFIRPAQREAFLELHRRVLAGGGGLGAFEVRGCAGELRWIEIQAGPLLDADGLVEAMICITRDITERKAAELQILSQLEELQRWRTVTLGREERVLELKDEVNALLEELGRAPRYENTNPDQESRT
ncbi:MAG: PAS domain-containing protein [Gammaproteobacteria bacterium]|nr:PAS domain-containing protein [Gammaproteobacteria bacterium]